MVGWRQCSLFYNHLYQKQGTLFWEYFKQKMNLLQAGLLSDVFWHEIKHHAKNVELDTFR